MFSQWVQPTGLVLTKLDGTAKGGIAVALAQKFPIPIRYVGLGEGRTIWCLSLPRPMSMRFAPGEK